MTEREATIILEVEDERDWVADLIANHGHHHVGHGVDAVGSYVRTFIAGLAHKLDGLDRESLAADFIRFVRFNAEAASWWIVRGDWDIAAGLMRACRIDYFTQLCELAERARLDRTVRFTDAPESYDYPTLVVKSENTPYVGRDGNVVRRVVFLNESDAETMCARYASGLYFSGDKEFFGSMIQTGRVLHSSVVNVTRR